MSEVLLSDLNDMRLDVRALREKMDGLMQDLSSKEVAISEKISDLSSVVSTKEVGLLGRIATVEENIARYKTVNDVVKYMMYFWTGLAAIAVVIGVKSFGDIEGHIKAKIDDKMAAVNNSSIIMAQKDEERDKKWAIFEKKSRESSDAILKIQRKNEELQESYEMMERIKQYKQTYDQLLSGEADIEGQIHVVLSEAEHRSANDDGIGDDSLYSVAWRNRAIITIKKFIDGMKPGKTIRTDMIFNVAQLCRRLQQYDLALQLTEVVVKRHNSPPHRALHLASVVQAGGSSKDAFSELLNLVVNRTDDNYHIVIAEAWNAS